jgi:hypothetical protein
MADPEIDAMSAVAEALGVLDEDAKGRVIRWAAERYGVGLGPARKPAAGGTGNGGGGGQAEDADEDADESSGFYQHFGELFAAAAPKTNDEKALVAAYWQQVHEGQETWQSRPLSTNLKHLGHALPNVTTALTTNINKKPQRVIQLKKTGNTMQGNKTYKVSAEGIKHVEGMLRGQAAS